MRTPSQPGSRTHFDPPPPGENFFTHTPDQILPSGEQPWTPELPTKNSLDSCCDWAEPKTKYLLLQMWWQEQSRIARSKRRFFGHKNWDGALCHYTASLAMHGAKLKESGVRRGGQGAAAKPLNKPAGGVGGAGGAGGGGEPPVSCQRSARHPSIPLYIYCLF